MLVEPADLSLPMREVPRESLECMLEELDVPGERFRETRVSMDVEVTGRRKGGTFKASSIGGVTSEDGPRRS